MCCMRSMQVGLLAKLGVPKRCVRTKGVSQDRHRHPRPHTDVMMMAVSRTSLLTATPHRPGYNNAPLSGGLRNTSGAARHTATPRIIEIDDNNEAGASNPSNNTDDDVKTAST
jgi:hypothetical protein